MSKRKIGWGLLFIAAAIFLVVNHLGLLSADISVLRVFLAAAFLCGLVDGIKNRSFPGIFFSIAFLWATIDNVLGVPELSLWILLSAALFLSIGFSFLFPEAYKRKYEKHMHDQKWKDYEDGDKVGEHQTVIDETASEDVYCLNRFGATTKYVNTSNLRSARLENHFGEMKVYFDHAEITQNQITISVDNSFGEMQLYFPRHWNVQVNVNATLADVSEKNAKASAEFPRVLLTGNTSLGEVAIFYI